MRFLKLVAFLWLLVALALTTTGLLTRPQHADVAVVLGNTVRSDGSPSPRLAARLSSALRLYERGDCRIIFVSGGTGTSGANEATSMRSWLIQAGVPSDRIAEDRYGIDTWATAHHAASFMRERGYTSAAVVTQYFHLPRAILALRRAGISDVSGTYPLFWERRDLYSIAREAPAFVWYAIRPQSAKA